MRAALGLIAILSVVPPVLPPPPPIGYQIDLARTSDAILAPANAVRVRPRHELLGVSRGGIPVTADWVGAGPAVVVVQGAFHGGPEANTEALTLQLRDYFLAHPEQIPARVSLAFIPEANPDGMVSDSRQYLSGVDPNRNWDTADWAPDGYDSNGRWYPGLGGPSPMSEPETRWLAVWLLDVRPAAVVQYHSRGGFLEGSRELAEPYSRASGYQLAPNPDALLGYRTTGTLEQWLLDHAIDTVLVELSSYTAAEFERNLAGLQALLRTVAPTAPAAAAASRAAPDPLPFLR